MRKVAQALGGSVGICFLPDHTCLTLECPVRTAIANSCHKRKSRTKSNSGGGEGEAADLDVGSGNRSGSGGGGGGAAAAAYGTGSLAQQGGWSLPPNVWGLAVDDSAFQRLLLGKLLAMAGVPQERVIVSGASVRTPL